jgi:hypothetical protein
MRADCPEAIPMEKLLALQNDQAYIAILGFNYNSFDQVLKKFAPMFSRNTPFDKSGNIVEFVKPRGKRKK